MKHCPECNRNYADPTISFCLQDGAPLVFDLAAAEPETAVLSADRPSEAATRTFEPKLNPRPVNGRFASGRMSIAAGIVGILLITAIGFGGYLYYGRGSSKQIASIAVMPFVNKTGNVELDYLSEGMTDTLIHTLSHVPDLRVKSRSSVFRYTGKDTDVKTLGRQLSVQAVLNGQLTQRGDGLWVVLELIDTTDESVIWVGQYDRKLSELVALQSEIARDVSNKLQARPSPTVAERPTENTEAYRQYLLGRYEWNKRRKESLLKAVDHFKTAIELDPAFALAHAALADCYIVFSTYEVAAPAESYALARAAVQKALELDATHGEAYATLASINDDYDWNFAAAERNYLQAIALNPNYAIAHQWYAEYLRMVGRFDEAVAHSNRAIDLDPVSLSVNLGLGESLYLAGRCNEAIPQFVRTIELDPGFASAHIELAGCYDAVGNHESAIDEARKAVELSDGSSSALANLAYSLGRAGNDTEARKIIEQLKKKEGTQLVNGPALARAYYAIGN